MHSIPRIQWQGKNSSRINLSFRVCSEHLYGKYFSWRRQNRLNIIKVVKIARIEIGIRSKKEGEETGEKRPTQIKRCCIQAYSVPFPACNLKHFADK
jgi:hypothetical protein